MYFLKALSFKLLFNLYFINSLFIILKARAIKISSKIRYVNIYYKKV